jgi:IS5 family transposase
MKQTSLGLGILGEMERVVPWSELVTLIASYMPEGKRGRPPFPVESLLRIHFMQQWFRLSDPAMEGARHDMPLLCDFAGLSGWDARLPDERTIMRFRHVLERHKLAEWILATVNLLLGASRPASAPKSNTHSASSSVNSGM